MLVECELKPLAEPRQTFAREFDGCLLPIRPSPIGIAFATARISLGWREGIRPERVHQVIEGYPVRHRPRDKFRVMDADVPWPSLLKWTELDIGGCGVVPSGFIFHADGAAENPDIARITSKAADKDHRIVLAGARPLGCRIAASWMPDRRRPSGIPSA